MIIAKIVNWANQELKAWEREAVKLFLTQNSISDKDKECLYHVLKKNLGLPYNNDLIKETDGVLKIEDICGTGEKNNKVVLRQIKDIKNVNAIPMDSSLSFANSGMTVIYGENGAGKSGYARILKKTCFARDEKEKIYGNIFASVTYVKPEAVITVDIDGEEKSYKWVDGGPKQKILGNICVFDRKSARIIVDEKNSVSYLPFGADVFQRLVDIIKEIKSKLDQEKPRLFKPEIADMPETTKAGAFFNSINAYTLKKDLVPWFQWDNSESNNSDEKRLAELTKKYLTAKDGDTTKQVQTLNNLKSRLKSFRKVLSNTAGLFSTESLDNFNQLIKAKHSFQIAYDIASTKPEGPLSGIATNEWEALYRAAKEYSIKYAYPNEDFPATTDDKKCVLCMQDLSLEASERLSRFHQFMENETKQSLENTTSKINEFITKLDSSDYDRILIDYKDVLDEVSNRNSDIYDSIKAYMDQATVLRNAYFESKKNNVICDSQSTELNFECIDEVDIIIDSEIEEHDKNSKPKELKILEIQLCELKAKKQFAINEKTISDYLFNLQTYELYRKAIASLETRAITQKGKDLIGQALTPQLKNALSTELKSFGFQHIPLDLKHSGNAGENLHQMKIKAPAGIATIKLTEVLSEGEQCVIAIAGFLAELNLQQNPMPIVFDDPVSSLDHKYSETIASRLVDESKIRQVVIFTHDISFMLELQSKSKARGLYCHCISVHREGKVAGKTRGEISWHAMKVTKRLDYIDQELLKIVPIFPEDKIEYNSKVAILYGYLRETWEAAIEEVLFNNTVRRFTAEVQTLRLEDVIIKEGDYSKIFDAMSKCCKWMIGHDLSKAINENRPTPADFQQDLRDFRDFISSLKLRRKASEKMNKIVRPQIG